MYVLQMEMIQNSGLALANIYLGQVFSRQFDKFLITPIQYVFPSPFTISIRLARMCFFFPLTQSCHTSVLSSIVVSFLSLFIAGTTTKTF